MQRIIYLILFCLIYIECLQFEAKEQTEFYKQQGLDLNCYSESGYIQVKTEAETENYLYYHIFLKEGALKFADVKDTDVFAIWLNGGPGGGSQFGNFEELGPVQIHQNEEKVYRLSKNQYSWNKLTHQIFIDQPFNTGLSYSKKEHQVTNCDQVAEYLTQFLVVLFQNRPDLKRAKLHIYGESYAGKYIPTIGAYVLKNQPDIKLDGIALGNGGTDPFHLASTHASLLYNLGTIDQDLRNKVQNVAGQVQQLMTEKQFMKASKLCSFLLNDVLHDYAGGFNQYDFQSYDWSRPQGFQNWLNDHKTQYNIPEFITYHQNNGEISKDFYEEFSQTRTEELIFILKMNKKVLLYNGQLDYTCNNGGQQTFLANLNWEHLFEWKQSRKLFIQSLNSKTGALETNGWYKQFENLMTATIYRSGHMVPADNPEAALEMMKLFLNNP